MFSKIKDKFTKINDTSERICVLIEGKPSYLNFITNFEYLQYLESCFSDVDEPDWERLVWHVDQFRDGIDVVVGRPFDPEALNQLAHPNLKFQLGKTLPDTHPGTVAEISD